MDAMDEEARERLVSLLMYCKEISQLNRKDAGPVLELSHAARRGGGGDGDGGGGGSGIVLHEARDCASSVFLSHLVRWVLLGAGGWGGVGHVKRMRRLGPSRGMR